MSANQNTEGASYGATYSTLLVCADEETMASVLDRLQPYQKVIVTAPKYSAIRGARRINDRTCCKCGKPVDHQEETDICRHCICKWFSESQHNAKRIRATD